MNRIVELLRPLSFAAAAVVTVAMAGPVAAQGTGSGLQVEEVIRSLKPAAPPPGVRTRGIPGRGISVEMPASAGASAEGGGASIEAPPSIDLSIEFDFNSHTLTDKGEAALNVLGEALTSNDLQDYRFMIAGHTDATGGEEYNQILSELRARTVKDFLTEQHKIGASRLVARGFGESRLLDPAKPDAAVNRRVQVTNLGEN